MSKQTHPKALSIPTNKQTTMGKKENIELSIKLLKDDGNERITLAELHNIIRRNGIVEQWRRKDIVMWLIALDKIRVNGQVVELI